MHTPHPNEYIWQEIHLMLDRVEQAINAAALYMQYLNVALAVAAVLGLAMLLMIAIKKLQIFELSRPLIRSATEIHARGFTDYEVLG